MSGAEAIAGGSATPAVDPAPERCDVAIAGAGIIGLAVARELLRRRPGLRVAVLEREGRIAAHQSRFNSGVLHAGIYYEPGSKKAELCVRGGRLLREYCAERGIAVDRCGKLIVAADEGELPGLAELERRGRANGVQGLRRVGPGEIAELEPHCAGVAALHSPATAVVDFARVSAALAADVRAAGGTISCGCEVRGVRRLGGGLILGHAGGVTEAGRLIACAGAWSDRLAVRAGASPDPRVVPFRGAYLRLRPERRELVRGLIYPVPDPRLPFLGVHLTRHASGEVLVGPTALLAGARDAYRLRTIRPRDLAGTLAWPGSWRLFRRFWRSGLRELRHAASRRSLLAAAARYVPELAPGDVEPGFAGVRAQALARDGTLVDDFAFSATADALHVRNAPSPAATSSLAIAEEIAERAERELGLGQ